MLSEADKSSDQGALQPLTKSGRPGLDIRLGDFVAKVDMDIPFSLAESWDKVGLLIGDPDALLTGVVLTLDITEQTVRLAESNDANLIIAHHPLIFSPLNTLREDIVEQSLIRMLIQKDIAVLALHTNLDAAVGGTADSLADTLELVEKSRSVFLPIAQASVTDSSMAAADSAQPNDDDFAAGPGHGRIIELDSPIDIRNLRKIVASRLGSSGVRLNCDRIAEISRLAVFPGSFDESWVDRLAELEVEAIITGEIKHHVGLKLAMRSIFALDTGHDVSERVVLPRLAHRLALIEPDLTFAVDYGFDYNKMAF